MKRRAAWLLVATVMLQFDPPALVLYLDAEDPPADAALVAKVACPTLRTEGIPLPVPYTIRRFQKVVVRLRARLSGSPSVPALTG